MTKIVPNKLLLSLQLCLILSTISPGNPLRGQDLQGKKLLVLNRMKTDLSHSPAGVTESGCVSIYLDRSFHLEQKVQRLPERKVHLDIHEGFLPEDKFREVKSLLGDEKLFALPHYVQPEIPSSNYYFENVVVEIDRGRGVVQTVGYSIWSGPKPNDSLSGASTEVKTNQYRARAILQPLLELLQNLSLDSSKVIVPDSTKIGCKN